MHDVDNPHFSIGGNMHGQYDISADTNPKLWFTSDVRPIGALVHTTSGVNSIDYLQGGVLKDGRIAGATALIARNGNRYVLTPRGRTAYHAGQSRLVYNGRLYQGDQVSALLIGVELENQDSTWCTYEQHDSLAEYIVSEGIVYGWRWPYYLLGHYEVARPIGRRSDPLGFDWGSFMGRLYLHARAANVGGLD